MATKYASKRKAMPGVKNGIRQEPKRAKIDTAIKASLSNDESDTSESDAFHDFSDSEDGGAKLAAGTSVVKKKQADVNSSRGASRPNGKPVDRGANSREAHQKQKQVALERKAAKPLADELQRAKKLWERLRRKSHVPKEERQKLVEELFGIISGRVKDFVLKHDAVRAVQTAIKYSTPDQRKQIAKELQGTYAQLAESRYAKFLIGKLLVQNDEEIRDLIIPEFYGKVRKLINHPEASWIVDDIYRGVATKEQKAMLLREWYGPEFALFRTEAKDATADLTEITQNEPSKRNVILKFLFDMINSLIQKKMTGFTMLHDAMLQYFLNVKQDSDEMKEFVEVIKEDENGDLLKNMAFTKSGARLASLLLAHGGAKDRKQILRTFKDTFQLMCGDPFGHIVILTAYDVIDDTVLTSKAIFPEILGKNEGKEVHNVIFCANNLNARTTICYLFDGPSKSLFPPGREADLALLAEIQDIRRSTSKKDPETRRKELVAALSPQLLSAVAASPADLVSSSFGCQFVSDVLLSTVGDKEPALQAIAATAAGDPGQPVSEETYPPPPPHVSTSTYAARMFKTLVGGGKFDKEAGKVKKVDPPLRFADILYPLIKDHVVSWATGTSSYVVLALLEAEDFSHSKELRQALTKHKKTLQQAAIEETAEQKAKREALAEKAGSKQGSKGKKAKQHAELAVGNMGSKLIIDMLDV